MGRPVVLAVGNSVVDVVGKAPDSLPRYGELVAGRGPADICIGGNGAIAAAAAAALGAGSALASAVGDDGWGRWLRERLEARGVDVTQLATLPNGPTSTTLSLVRPDGERALLTHNGVSDLHDLSEVDVSGLIEGSWLLVGALFLVPAYSGEALRDLAQRARSRGARVAMDLSWDPTGRWDLGTLPLEEADLVLGNELELRAATCTTGLEDAIDVVVDRGASTVVAKLGSSGARLIAGDHGGPIDVPAPEVDAKNATGTGDVFNAALLVGLQTRGDWEEATRFACAAGALRVSRGCDAFPTLAEVEEAFLR